MRQAPLHHRYLRFPVLLLVLLTVFLQFPGSRDLINTPYSGIETLNLTVQNINSKGPNAEKPIELNDEIISVAGVPVRNYKHLRSVVRKNGSFEPTEYVLERNGEEFTVEVEYVTIPSSIVHRRFGLVLVGFTFLLTGLLVLLRRTDTIGITFALTSIIICYLLGDRPVFDISFLQIAGELFDDAAMIFFPAVFLHFFLVFPDRLRPPGKRELIRRALLIYTIPTLIYLISCVFAIRNFYFDHTPTVVLTLILSISTLYITAYLVASMVVFVRNYRSSTVAQRQKLRIAIGGTIVGMLPFLSMIVWRQIMPGTYTTWEFVCSLGLAFVSVSFAYAILKHGAIELNIVVRKSIVYAFLTGVIIAAYYGVVRFLGDYFTTEFKLDPTYFSVITVLVLAVIFAPARQIVQGVVDRLFFRGEYDYRQEVVEFNREISHKIKSSEILDHFSNRIGSLLKASYFVFYRYDQEDGRLALDTDNSNGAKFPETFPTGSLLGRYLSRYRKPLMVEYLDNTWERRYLDGPSLGFLASTQAAVCLPVGSADALFGLIILGKKRSGLLYTQTDSELLETLSEHLGLVLENADLHEASIQQERLKNEVMLAREIQLDLLPKKPPHHSQLDLAGKMVSSVEVGGDYFDYFALDANRIGVAIGDVSGKGVPAAMLMSSLQAVFKNLAVRDRMNPSDVVGELNKHLCANAKSELFTTFFYGIIDMIDSTFSFCNAGHCPAILLKTEFADRLGEGGLILGIDSNHVYTEGRVRLDPGDILFLYTDGVTEQASPTDEEYGEDRLIRFLKANRNLPLGRLQDSLFATILAFGDGKQHDDITNVIVRYKNA